MRDARTKCNFFFLFLYLVFFLLFTTSINYVYCRYRRMSLLRVCLARKLRGNREEISPIEIQMNFCFVLIFTVCQSQIKYETSSSCRGKKKLNQCMYYFYVCFTCLKNDGKIKSNIVKLGWIHLDSFIDIERTIKLLSPHDSAIREI